ncbi:MAG: MAPEG family protein [Gammaproteobacteria bacterium]
MDWVIIIIMLALLEYIFFSIQVGRARARFEVPAPATSGHPEFERYFRVHQNTLEQLIIFIPAIVLYAHVGSAMLAAAAGVAFLVGRMVYFVGYVKDPKSRSIGFMIGFLANAFLIIATLIGAVRNML